MLTRAKLPTLQQFAMQEQYYSACMYSHLDYTLSQSASIPLYYTAFLKIELHQTHNTTLELNQAKIIMRALECWRKEFTICKHLPPQTQIGFPREYNKNVMIDKKWRLDLRLFEFV